jgi:hypothetical protein
MEFLRSSKGQHVSIDQICGGIAVDEFESVFKICEHLAANPQKGIAKKGSDSIDEITYCSANT